MKIAISTSPYVPCAMRLACLRNRVCARHALYTELPCKRLGKEFFFISVVLIEFYQDVAAGYISYIILKDLI